MSSMQALLRHAIAPSSVTLEFWKFLQLCFNDALQLHGAATLHTCNPFSSLSVTVNGQPSLKNLLNMSEAVLGDLIEKMNTHACNWITRLFLPSVFLSPFLCEGPR